MDIHQLRSWIFELYDPLADERQYIVFDRARGNLLIDAPPFSDRALRLIRGTGRASLLVATNAERARDAHRYREALGVQVIAHEDDARAIEGGADLVVKDRELVRPDATAIRAGSSTVVLVTKAGGVLFCGDLDLASEDAVGVKALEFSAVLSSKRPPMWNAGRDELLRAQQVLPRPRKRFGIFFQAPWDRAFAGRLEDKLAPSPLVPRERTAAREAAMGGTTLVVATAERSALERPKRPSASSGPTEGATPPPAPPTKSDRPRAFDENWSAPSSPMPATTIPNAPTDIQPIDAARKPHPLGARFARLGLEELVGAPSVDYFWGGIHLSPDGREVAFAWNRTGTYEIFSAPVSGDRIFQLTDAKQRCVVPRWSPDGARIAFLRDAGGDERFGIWLVDRDGARERELISEPGVMHREIVWSPDGARIACVADVGGGAPRAGEGAPVARSAGGATSGDTVITKGKAFAIHVVDARTGARTALTDGTTDDNAPSWSPDGKTIAFWSRRGGARTDADLYLVASTGGPITKLETRAGVAGESTAPRWSPDGSRIAFTTTIHGRSEIAIATLDGTTVRDIEYVGHAIYDDTDAVWRRDARVVYYSRTQDANVAVRGAFVASHADTPVADEPGVHRSVQAGPDGGSLAYLFTGAKRPADVFVRPAGLLEPRALTSSLSASIDPATLIEPVHVHYPGEGGLEIPALLYVPHAEAIQSAGPPPAIVHIHGGPTGQHFRWWDFTSQLFANRGYVVLAPNIRGSTGYGRTFQEANRRDWGGKDMGDVVRGVEWLIAQGLADRKRIAAYGVSYGGYMTLLCLGRAPTLWAAGVSVVGVVNWKSMHETSRGDLREYLERELGDPTKDAALFADRSPLTHVASITAPLLVLQGANDPRVPKNEADQLVSALAASKKTFEAHTYEGEGHGFRTLANRIDSLKRATEWFDRYLTR